MKNAWYQHYFNIVGKVLVYIVRYEKQTQKYVSEEKTIFQIYKIYLYIEIAKESTIRL